MKNNRMTEYIELDEAKRWEYMKRYYEVTSRFYDVPQQVISEKEIQKCIANFKEKPSPKIRKEIKLKDWKFALDEENQGLRKEYYSFDHDEKGWESVTVPHSYRHIPEDPVKFGRLPGEIVGSYSENIWKSEYSSWYKVRLPVELAADEVAYLSFESVNLLTDVWVNENPVMMGHLGLRFAWRDGSPRSWGCPLPEMDLLSELERFVSLPAQLLWNR